MGLDEFKSEDSDSNGSSNSSSSSSSGNIPASRPDESTNYRDDKFPIQTFDKTDQLTPRAIKQQVKAHNYKWKKQFSTYRLEPGELVMYSAGVNTAHKSHTLMVFTTILPLDVDHYMGEERPIWVVPWNLKSMEPHAEGQKFHRDENWEEQLNNMLRSNLGEAGRKFRERDW